ncbi:outer membrane protein [Bradyrhizobium guangxiense]|uniref:outer membrane protein n=1 Tax=Bradyrhizobium guangxiense TaxID=1325115 RepID=UPI0010086BD2|nr:outer membrane beta-barrel protein [Bradyrhizobium guangxiense]
MKKQSLVCASILAMAAATSASAADLAARPAFPNTPTPSPAVIALYDWSGFYAGVNGGWGWSHNSWDFLGSIPEGSHDATGGTVGGQIGYRWQFGNTVLGLEGLGNWADLSGSNVSIANPGTTNHTNIDGFGLLTGQIGYSAGNVLLYAKAGAAVVGSTYRITNSAGFLGDADTTRWGGTAGAGLEISLTPNWSAGIEYDHVFMPASDVSFATGLGNDRIRQDFDLVTARLNYKFGWPLASK